MSNDMDVDSFLSHYGIKGMRWGVRKSSVNTDPSKKKPTRSEKKAAKKEFYQQKAQRVLTKAMDDPETLINLKTPATFPSIVSGREFVDYVSRGGAFDIKLTDVFAEKTPDGYVTNAQMNARYRG